MSWGHAVSTDLVQWTQLPLAIPTEGDEAIFSGSAVVDRDNTSGLGSRTNPAMVAIYTSARPGSQAQSLAYSTDRGRTWTKYVHNPVLDIGSGEFRDPKVFWYAPARRWIMTVAQAVARQISFYSSPDLIHWAHLSDFGPAKAVAGVWECPDLFPLAVDGDPQHVKWVLVVNINPGAIAGGSGAQYFVGDFDGTRFTADDAGPYTPPTGDVLQDFEGADYGGWTATGTAFGSGPAHGTLPGQQEVGGFEGGGLVNTFIDFDGAQGTLTSPPFTLTKPYINLLVGGGSHPHVEGTGDGTPPPGTVLADFEGDTYGPGWTATGDFAGTGPVSSGDGHYGERNVDTFFGATHNGDDLRGSIVSPDFTIDHKYLNFLIGGGRHPYPGEGPTAVNLVVDGAVVRTATGGDSGVLNWVAWDVDSVQGRTAHVEIVDQATGGWGHLLADQFMLADEPALPRATETAVDLVVDGQVVRTATGSDSEHLDWASWNAKTLAGKEARIRIVDANSGGWGHVLADQITLADGPAQSATERADWIDFGKDFYAATTYNDAPGGRRLAIGWMNNWEYGNVIPTSPWRSAMAVPRELALRTLDGRPQLVQEPVGELASLRSDPSFAAGRRVLGAGTWTPSGPGATGKALDIDASFVVRDAARFGVRVRVGDGERTVIGYDADAQQVYVDRTASGEIGFAPTFPGVQRAPLPVVDGKVYLRILVDWSSVEVFADDGRRVITDQVFPGDASQGVQLFSEGGSTVLDQLAIRPLRSAWTATG
jgi:levanase